MSDEDGFNQELILKSETVKAILAFSIPVMVLLIVIVACYKALAGDKPDIALLTMIFPALMLWGGIVYRDFFAKGAELTKKGGGG